MGQERAPLWDALLEQRKACRAQLHIPGHRGGQGLPIDFLRVSSADIFAMDLTEIPGTDDLHNPQGPIAEAQALAAELYGADRSFFLVNGTSVGLMALIMACCGTGDKIIVPRNAHRSVLSGLVMSGAYPIYYRPSTIEHYNCLAGPEDSKIQEIYHKYSGIRAVLAINPTYYGVAGEMVSLAKFCHRKRVPLLVDEAHGSHLRFHPAFPPDALSSGAAAVVQSTHKMGGSLTQSSLLHLKGELICHRRVADALRMLQSTSPSYLLMASLDLARRQLALSGTSIWQHAYLRARWCRERLAKIEEVRVLELGYAGQAGFRDLDPTRLTISVKGLTGYQLANILFQKNGVVVEMADYTSVVAVISLGTSNADCRRLIWAIKEVASGSNFSVGFSEAKEIPDPVLELSPREAWLRSNKTIDFEQCRELVSAEAIAVYPPGIPVLCPGERITKPVFEYLREARSLGFKIQGPADTSLQTIRIII